MKTTSLIAVLKKYQPEFNPVIPFSEKADRLISMDLTGLDKDLTEEIANDTKKFTEYINQKLQLAHARYGIGGYGELRTVYSRSKVFDAENPDEEPRRLHIGTDIWGKPNTAIIAPVDGIVHSFAFNNNYGDYGTTIILSHQLDGVVFYTLYGHLGLNSIKNLHEGQRIEKGDIFADFGIPAENGHWPPHLHFQVIENMEGWEGDYPGVCKFSEKERWMENCPDPDLILNLNRFTQ